jgi:hypothetical protein
MERFFLSVDFHSVTRMENSCSGTYVIFWRIQHKLWCPICWSFVSITTNDIDLYYTISEVYSRHDSRCVKINFVIYLVPVGGLEPPRPKATDFKSVMSTIPSHGPGVATLLILFGVSSLKNSFILKLIKISFFY